MIRIVKNGWRNISADGLCAVYVENSIIVRAMKLDVNRSAVPANVYKTSPNGGLDIVRRPRYETFRRGLCRGTYFIY